MRIDPADVRDVAAVDVAADHEQVAVDARRRPQQHVGVDREHAAGDVAGDDQRSMLHRDVAVHLVSARRSRGGRTRAARSVRSSDPPTSRRTSRGSSLRGRASSRRCARGGRWRRGQQQQRRVSYACVLRVKAGRRFGGAGHSCPIGIPAAAFAGTGWGGRSSAAAPLRRRSPPPSTARARSAYARTRRACRSANGRATRGREAAAGAGAARRALDREHGARRRRRSPCGRRAGSPAARRCSPARARCPATRAA